MVYKPGGCLTASLINFFCCSPLFGCIALFFSVLVSFQLATPYAFNYHKFQSIYLRTGFQSKILKEVWKSSSVCKLVQILQLDRVHNWHYHMDHNNCYMFGIDVMSFDYVNTCNSLVAQYQHLCVYMCSVINCL